MNSQNSAFRHADVLQPETTVHAGTMIANLLKQLDEQTDSEKMLVCAIDGRSASGKSTLAKAASVFFDNAMIIHLDDFFLQPHQRTQQRLDQPGQNIDHERLRAELLEPLMNGKTGLYRKYDCKRNKMTQGFSVHPVRFLFLEGTYSLNDELLDYSDLRIFTTCSPSRQRERLIGRNGYSTLEEFEKKWIPLEEYYFHICKVSERAQHIFVLDCPLT